MRDVVDELATIIRPVPVAVFLVPRNTVATINDRHYTYSAPAGSTNSHADRCACGRSSSSAPESGDTASGNAEPPVHHSQPPSASDQTPVHVPSDAGPSTSSTGYSHSRNDRQGGGKDPNNPLERAQPGTKNPFIGLVTLLGATGVHQRVRLCMGLYLETPSPLDSNQCSMTTDITMDCLQLELLEARTESAEGPEDLDASLVRPVACELTIQPVGEHTDCSLFEPRPSEQDYRLGFTTSIEGGAGVTLIASPLPAVHLQFSGKTGKTQEHVGLAEIIDMNNMSVKTRGDPPKRVWWYPFHGTKPISTVSLLPHSERANYYPKTPLSGLKFTLEARLEIQNSNRGVGRLQRLWRKPTEVLSVDYKHVKVRFAIEIMKHENEMYLRLEGPQAAGSTVKLQHKIPFKKIGEGNKVEKPCSDNDKALTNISSEAS
jgi:hypothetical protein